MFSVLLYYSTAPTVCSTEVVVDGDRAKNGMTMANARDITFPDGRKMSAGSSGTGAPNDEKK